MVVIPTTLKEEGRLREEQEVGIDNAGPIALVAEITSHPENADLVARMLLDYAAIVTQEPGNILFAPTHSRTDPSVFLVYEEYASDEAFRKHLASDHNAQFNATLTPLVTGGGSRLTMLSPLRVVE